MVATAANADGGVLSSSAPGVWLLAPATSTYELQISLDRIEYVHNVSHHLPCLPADLHHWLEISAVDGCRTAAI